MDLPDNSYIDPEWGNVIVPGAKENISQVVYHALAEAKTVEDIDAYPMPDKLAKYRWEHIQDTVKSFHKRNLAVMGGMGCSFFESAWGVRGFENFF